jgi:hypothetical protein
MAGVPLLHAVARASYRRRGESEDRAQVHELDDGLLVVLADGAGGIPGGAAAADAVLAGFARAIGDRDTPLATAADLCAVLARIDGECARAPLVGESTAVVIRVGPEGLCGASAGDSGAWLVPPRGHDELTEHQARKRRIGSGQATPVGFARAQLEGTLLVATDGLLRHVDAALICKDARGIALEAAACALVALARTPAGDLLDDVAVVLVREG